MSKGKDLILPPLFLNDLEEAGTVPTSSVKLKGKLGLTTIITFGNTKVSKDLKRGSIKIKRG